VRPTLTLAIAVYKGQDYWKECWESVKPLAGYFDKVFISINKSEYQQEDIEVLTGGDIPANVSYFVQTQMLDTTDHLMACINAIKTDYVFFLRHDDWLLQEGLEEVINILEKHCGENIAIFGAQEWIETDSCYKGITRELMAFPEGITTTDFILYDIDKEYTFNTSGVVVAVKKFVNHSKVVKLFKRGTRFDNLLLTYPGVEMIFQTFHPSTRIRILPGEKNNAESILDNMTYYFFQAVNHSDDYVVVRLTERLVNLSHFHRTMHAMCHFIKLVFISLRWGVALKNIFHVVILFVSVVGTRVWQHTRKFLLARSN
jgi:Glycosyl transferase family 2.